MHQVASSAPGTSGMPYMQAAAQQPYGDLYILNAVIEHIKDAPDHNLQRSTRIDYTPVPTTAEQLRNHKSFIIGCGKAQLRVKTLIAQTDRQRDAAIAAAEKAHAFSLEITAPNILSDTINTLLNSLPH